MSAQWPTLADVSLDLTAAALAELEPSELGIFVRIAWALAAQSVNTYSLAVANPRLVDDDTRMARIALCSPKEWRAAKQSLSRFLEVHDGHWVLSDPSVIRISRPSVRNPIPTAVKARARARAGHLCAYCGDENGPFHFDHLYPVARGGTDEAHNIVVACRECNLSKGDKTILEWVEYLRGRS